MLPTDIRRNTETQITNSQNNEQSESTQFIEESKRHLEQGQFKNNIETIQQPKQQPAQTQVNLDRNSIFRKHLELKYDTTQSLLNYEVQEVSKQQVRLYVQERKYIREQISIMYGLKNVVTSFTKLNYLTCRIGLGRQCELCECTDPKLGRLYMIPVSQKIRFVHTLCVHYSKGFKINQSGGKIENYEEAVQKFIQQTCQLCCRPNASLECAGTQNNIPCKNQFHVHCLFNRQRLGEVKGDNYTIVCNKCKNQKAKTRELQNEQEQHNFVDLPTRKIIKIRATFGQFQESVEKRQLLQDIQQINTENQDEQQYLVRFFGQTVANCLRII